MKKCAKCGLFKSFSKFAKNKRRKNGIGSYCRLCLREILRKYRTTDRWHDWRRDYYWKTKERELQGRRIYYQRHKEERREYDRQYHEENKEKRNQYACQWRESNKDRVKALAAKRRRLELQGDCFTALEWRELCSQYNWTCLCCRQREPKIKLTPDHVFPLSKGGSNRIDNIQPLCFDCNRKKMTQSTDYRLKEKSHELYG